MRVAQCRSQENRGQSVPLQLLNRVMAAHANWPRHQTNRHREDGGAGLLLITQKTEETCQSNPITSC